MNPTDKINSVLNVISEELMDEHLTMIAGAMYAASVNKALPQAQLKALFNLYNLYYKASEYSYFCGACRNKVFKGLPLIEALITQRLNG